MSASMSFQTCWGSFPSVEKNYPPYVISENSLKGRWSREDVSSSDEEQTSYSRHELRERKALVQGMGEALKNRATGLVGPA